MLSLSADTWVTHVGWVAGASFVAATSRFYQKQTKLGFWKVAEASRWLFSQHSAVHSITQWCIFFFFLNQTILYCHPLECKWVQSFGQDLNGFGRGGLNSWQCLVECCSSCLLLSKGYSGHTFLYWAADLSLRVLCQKKKRKKKIIFFLIQQWMTQTFSLFSVTEKSTHTKCCVHWSNNRRKSQ